MTIICKNICMKQILALFLCPTRYDQRNIMFHGCPSVRQSVRPSHCMGITLCTELSKSYDFSTSYQVQQFNGNKFKTCLCHPRCFLYLYLLYVLYCIVYTYTCIICTQINQIQKSNALQWPYDVDEHLLFCFGIDLHLSQCLAKHGFSL